MQLEELKSLMAASILSGRLANTRLDDVSDSIIEKAVKVSQRIWEEVLRQER